MSFMECAIECAKKTPKNEVPVGAVIVYNNKIISMAINAKEKNLDVTSHAEIIAIRQASKKMNNWRLENCDMYVTLEPCPMCGWAIIQSRINNLYFGSYDYNYGCFLSKFDIRKYTQTSLKVWGGIKEKECDKIINNFFTSLRINN